MIVQNIYIEKYDWYIEVFYAVEGINIPSIMEALENIHCSDEDLNESFSLLSRSEHNVGLTYSNFAERSSVVVIGLTDSAAEFQDTFDHEKGHLVMHISLAEGIDPFGEEYQYLAGEIGKKMFNTAKLFMCDNCRAKLTEFIGEGYN